MADRGKEAVVDDEIDTGIRALLREPASPSAPERAMSFASTRLELDMAEIARMRRGDHRRRLGRAVAAIFLLLVCAVGVATAIDSRFLGRVLGEDVVDAPTNGVTSVSSTIAALKRPEGSILPDDLWDALQQVAEVLAPGGTPFDRTYARVVLRYDELHTQVHIAAAQKVDGRACFVARGAVTNRGCTKGFDEQTPLVAQLGRAADRSSVVGLAADEVRSVTIELPGEDRVAVLRNNAFFWLADHASDTPQGVVAEYADGTRIHLRLANAPAQLPRPGP